MEKIRNGKGEYKYPASPGKDTITPPTTPLSPSGLSEAKKDALIRDLRRQILELMKYKEHVSALKSQVNALEEKDKQITDSSIAKKGSRSNNLIFQSNFLTH